MGANSSTSWRPALSMLNPSYALTPARGNKSRGIGGEPAIRKLLESKGQEFIGPRAALSNTAKQRRLLTWCRECAASRTGCEPARLRVRWGFLPNPPGSRPHCSSWGQPIQAVVGQHYTKA